MRDKSPETLKAEVDLLMAKPEAYLQMMTERLRQDPNDASLYFSRHHASARLGRLDDALADLDRSVEMDDMPIKRLARGAVLARLGRYRDALTDFQLGEAADTDKFIGNYWPLHGADCHARLGNLEAAMSECARITDGFFSPGLDGTPRGYKPEIEAELRRRAAAARHGAP